MPSQYTISKLDNISQLHEADVVVIFGKTRAGKSAFINDAYGREILTSTDSMISDTTTIAYVDQKLQIGEHAVHLVDTIGLGGSGHSDDITHLTRAWINIFRNHHDDGPLHPTVKAFLYFIDISDAAGMNQDNQDNLRFFQSLVGTQVLDSVFFVTTKWAPARPPSVRQRQERFYEEWKTKVNEDFPGAHLVRLDDEIPRPDDEDLRADNPDISEDGIRDAKATYRNNIKNILGSVLLHPATVPTQTEAEINGGGGAEVSIGDTSVGKCVKAKIDKNVQAMSDAGNTNEAERLRRAVTVFSAMKVDDVGTIQFTIQTVHKRGVTVSLPFGSTIRDCKGHLKKKYPLNPEDQYYSSLPAIMPEVNDNDGWLKVSLQIYPDEFQIRDGCTLLLRTDTYLSKKEITQEARRLAKTCGKDTLGSLDVVNSKLIQAGGELGIFALQAVNSDIYRQQIRMWKRSTKEITTDTEQGIATGFVSAVFNLTRNCVDGVLKKDLQDKGAEHIYDSIGA